MSKRVGLYARVSGKGQVDNTSLDNQLGKCRACAKQRGDVIIGEAREIVTGASRWGARRKLNEFFAMGDKGELDAIIVDVPDRLGRGRALATLLDRAQRHGLEIVFANGWEPTDTNVGVGMIISSQEREDIGRRTREGRLNTIAKGGIVFSAPPYGYEIVKVYSSETGKKLSAHVRFAPEIANVRQIYHWLTKERKSLHGIQVALFEAKVLPPSLRDWTWDSVPEGTSKLWARATVRNILTNRAYIGKWYYNVVATKREERGDGIYQKRLGRRAPSEWVYVEIPPAVSPEVFEAAQAILAQNRQQLAGRASAEERYLLKGMLFCQCGWRMIGVTYRSGNGAYRCKRDVTRVDRQCLAPRISQDAVEEAVWRFLLKMMLNPERMLAEAERYLREQEQVNAPLREQAEALRAEIAKAHLRLERAVDSLLDGTLDKPTFGRKKEEIEATIREAEGELAQVENRLKHTFSPGELSALKEQLGAYFGYQVAELLRGNTQASLEEKRQLLRTLDVKVTWLPEDDAVLVEGAFPAQKLSIPSSRDVRPW